MEGWKEIEEILNAHSPDILTDPRRNFLDDIEVITSRIPSLVSKDQNQLSMKYINLQEVQDVVI